MKKRILLTLSENKNRAYKQYIEEEMANIDRTSS